MTITIRCELMQSLGQSVTDVTVSFDLSRTGEGEQARLEGWAMIEAGFLSAKVRCQFAGFLVVNFVEGLRRVYDRSPQEAYLLDDDHQLLLCVYHTPRRPSRVLLSGEWDGVFGRADLAPEDRHLTQWDHAGPQLVFQALEMEPAAILGLISQFTRLLQETGVPTDRHY